MICPRCGNERGAIAITSPCPQCGFALYMNKKPEQTMRPGSTYQKNAPVYNDSFGTQSSDPLTNVVPKWSEMTSTRVQSGNLPVDSVSPLEARGLPRTGPFEQSEARGLPRTGPFGQSEARGLPDEQSSEKPESGGLPGFRPFGKPQGLSDIRQTERADSTGRLKTNALERANEGGPPANGMFERPNAGGIPLSRSPSGRLTGLRRPSHLPSAGAPRPVRLTPSGPSSSQRPVSNSGHLVQGRQSPGMAAPGDVSASTVNFQVQQRDRRVAGREEGSSGFASTTPQMDRLFGPVAAQSPGAEEFQQQLDIDRHRLQRGSNGVPGQQSSPSQVHRPLMPGTLLRGGRYRLQELLERQDWMTGVFEAVWIGRDAHRGGGQVMICEVVIPDNASVLTQSIMRNATLALASVGRHSHATTLWDAFNDAGCGFFVFEFVDGQSLTARLRHLRHPLSEQESVEICLQVSEVLDLLAHHSPPLVHGLIRPEHVYVSRTGNQYILGNFSVLLAGGATQVLAGMGRSFLSPYSAPEFNRGMIDIRCDLYSLMATAYYAVTGSAPIMTDGIVQRAQQLNPAISDEFDAILARGLRPIPEQRYQRPAELRQDLLAMRSVSGSLVSNGDVATLFGGGVPAANTLTTAPGLSQPRLSESFPLQFISLPEDEDENAALLPPPEELPPMREGNDRVGAAVMLVIVLVSLTAVTMLSHFHM